jgi:TRAP-type C4-dicarboxylate transport system permease small subunit
MKKQDQVKLVSPLAQVLCLLASVLFGLYMWSVLPEFIPAKAGSTTMLVIQSFVAFLFGALFWISSMCFTVVLVDMRRRRKEIPGLSD